jgi:hypothetical protein
MNRASPNHSILFSPISPSRKKTMNGDLEMKHWSGKKGNDRYTMENFFGAINFNAKFQKGASKIIAS